MSHCIVRRATSADSGALAAFNADVSRYQDADEPDAAIAAWTRDLLDGRHPRVTAGDFVVVEDTHTGAIVSSVGLISQTWSYDGIAVEVGQPELVGTHPDYRGQGLVRRQFELLHQWSAERRQALLAIDGIPGFYRQLGYEMALELRGELSVDVASVPPLPRGTLEPFQVRPADDRDLPFIAKIFDSGAVRYLVTCRRDEMLWRYELHGRSAGNPWRPVLCVVETANGQPVGFLAHACRPSGARLMLTVYELKHGASWHDVTPSVLRYLRATGEDFRRIGFCLSTEHPAYAAINDLAPRNEGAYAWQIRVPNLPGFLQHITPVLERRLAASALASYTGELSISFYRDGLRLAFTHGRVTSVVPWQQSLALSGIEKMEPTTAERAVAYFPGRTFLQLVLGFRSLDELQHAFSDCLVRTGEVRAVLCALFPKQPSNVWPLL